MASSIISQDVVQRIAILDETLSKRFIALDPKGYFLIKVDQENKEIVVEHYSNDIDAQGRAIDPETGKPLGCRGSGQRVPLKIYRGQSAKELGIQLTEKGEPQPISKLDHALYLGRELQRAEQSLIHDELYIQD